MNYSHRQEIGETLAYIHTQASMLSVSEETDTGEYGQVQSIFQVFRRQEEARFGSLDEAEERDEDIFEDSGEDCDVDRFGTTKIVLH